MPPTSKPSKPVIIAETNIIDIAEDNDSIAMTEDIQAAATEVARAYSNNIQYPAYSQPITKLDTDRLEPNKFIPISSPLDDGSNVTVALEKYRFIYPENISIRITGPEMTSVKVLLQDVNTNKVLGTQFADYDENAHFTSFLAKQDYPRDLQLVVTTMVAGKRIPVVAQIQYFQASAEIIDFETPYPDNADMVIPAIIDVTIPGKYRLRGNLYNAELPLAHLVSTSSLTSGKQVINLKAHWSVFSEQHSQLRLTNFVLEKMSPSPFEPALYGSSQVSSININDFTHGSLMQLPYEPTSQEQQSLRFLNELAQPNRR